jgi:hypothetical protein
MSEIGHRNQGSFASSSAVSVVVPCGVGAETAVRRRIGDACAQ